MPEVPPEGFKFGPSKIIASDKEETTAHEQSVAASLRPDAIPFVPTSAPAKNSGFMETTKVQGPARHHRLLRNHLNRQKS
jgi:hypothetical protein